MIQLGLLIAAFCLLLAIAIAIPGLFRSPEKTPLQRAIDQLSSTGVCMVTADTAELLKRESTRRELDLVFEQSQFSRLIRVRFAR